MVNIGIMKTNTMNNEIDVELVEEGFGGQMIQLGLLASVLGFAGIVNASKFKNNVKEAGKMEERGVVDKSELKDIIEDSRPDDYGKMYGEWRRDKAINVIARTLWMEARGEGVRGLNMVMTVIWNRAGGNSDYMVKRCLEYKQFSCWNDKTNKTPSAYDVVFPSEIKAGASQKDIDIWNTCQRLANQALDETFVPVNDKWNAYYNPKICNPSWGKSLNDPEMVGNHKVGSLKEWEIRGNRVAKVKADTKPSTNVSGNIYIVKKNDSLWKIAKNNNTTVAKLKSLNNLKSDTIKPGMKLKV